MLVFNSSRRSIFFRYFSRHFKYLARILLKAPSRLISASAALHLRTISSGVCLLNAMYRPADKATSLQALTTV